MVTAFDLSIAITIPFYKRTIKQIPMCVCIYIYIYIYTHTHSTYIHGVMI